MLTWACWGSITSVQVVSIKRSSTAWLENLLTWNLLFFYHCQCFGSVFIRTWIEPALIINCKHINIYNLFLFCDLLCGEVKTWGKVSGSKKPLVADQWSLIFPNIIKSHQRGGSGREIKIKDFPTMWSEARTRGEVVAFPSRSPLPLPPNSLWHLSFISTLLIYNGRESVSRERLHCAHIKGYVSCILFSSNF